jgi:hypothetical protein
VKNGSSDGSRDAWAADSFAPLPGDTVSLPGDQRAMVETVYLCAEPDEGTVTRWSWIVFSDGRLLEVAPRGCALYESPQVLVRGSGPFLELVAQDGALVRFEERVRAGTWEARPVRLTLGGRRWRVTSTGTVSAQRLGPAPASGWGQLRGGPYPPTPSPVRGGGGAGAGEGAMNCAPTGADSVEAQFIAPSGGEVALESDVYFTFVSPNDPNALGLGLWATDVILAFGRRLGDSPATAGLTVIEG